jgi:AmiR/NasT family two-component response regulator
LNPELPNPNRVLVIDDEESIHKLVLARLRPEGIEVTSELDGQCGIERAIEDPPDLILLDVGLPVMDTASRSVDGSRSTMQLGIFRSSFSPARPRPTRRSGVWTWVRWTMSPSPSTR